MSGNRRCCRYSLAFKQKIVSEIESGHLTVADAQRIYDITGGTTVYRWLRQLGKNHLISKVIRIEMKDEKDKIKELERQKKELEWALSQAHLKNLCLESLIECVEEQYKVDVKKTFGDKASTKRSLK